MPAISTANLRLLMDIAIIHPGNLRNALVSGDPETLFLVKAKDRTGKIGGERGTDCDVYYIVNAKDHQAYLGEPEEYLNSYIVDYSEGETNFHILGTEADFCFTVTINGCTFALGIPGLDGTLMVSHTNMKNKASGKVDRDAVLGGVEVPLELGGAVQENLQSRVVRSMYGGGSMLGPSQYYNPTRSNNLTVFGIRGAAGWTFQYLSYRYENRTFYHEGVHDFGANSIAI